MFEKNVLYVPIISHEIILPHSSTGERPWENNLYNFEFHLQDFLMCLLWTFHVENESNFIMEHVFHALNDELWAKREQIFKDFESDDYIDAKTLRLVKDKKDYKPRSVVKNDLKHTRELTEMKLDMTANQCLVTRVGEKHPRHTLKSIGEWTFNRKKTNETYIAMAECLKPIPLYFVHNDQKQTIDRDQ